MKILRTIVEINEDLCNGCGQCILDCAEGAIALVDGKAKVIADRFCDGLGACLTGCPTGALSLIQRAAAPYDEEAVHQHLAAQGQVPAQPVCPGSRPSLTPHACGTTTGIAPEPNAGRGPQWPLKLRLMPPDAPMLQGADILLAADCAAFACPDFRARFMQDKMALIACPKFEGAEAVTERLAQVFRASKPRSCTVARMEVPCCQGLSRAIQAARAASGHDLMVNEVILGRDGNVAAVPMQGLPMAIACGG